MFSNLDSSEILGIKTEVGILVRMLDKIKRLNSFAVTEAMKVKEESVEDTVKDIINYAILFRAKLKTRESE